MTAPVKLPDVIGDELYTAAVEVIEGHSSLVDANAAEPKWNGMWQSNGEQAWMRWDEEEYGPAFDRWWRTVDALRQQLGVEAFPGSPQATAHAVIDAWRSQHVELVRPLCESCAKREAITTVVVDGEPFRVCGICVLHEAGAVAS